MPSGFQSGASDLDALFLDYRYGTKASATGLTTNGVDISDRFQPRLGTAKRADVGILTGATDVSDLFWDITVPTPTPTPTVTPTPTPTPTPAPTATPTPTPTPTVTISITDQNPSAVTGTPSTATAGYRLLNTGVAQTLVFSTYTDISGEWMSGGTASDYDVMATLNSGGTPSGDSVNTWLNLGNSREWFVSTNSGFLSSTMTIEIRPAGGGATIDSCFVTIDAESS